MSISQGVAKLKKLLINHHSLVVLLSVAATITHIQKGVSNDEIKREIAIIMLSNVMYDCYSIVLICKTILTYKHFKLIYYL